MESSLQAAASIGAQEKDGLLDLVRKAKRSSEAVDRFPSELLDRFRVTRNRITHRGFSPKDDSESASLFLEVGLPFLSLCYGEFHSFDFKDGLLKEYAEQLAVALEVHSRARNTSDLDLSYCLHSFTHLIRWAFKGAFSLDWEIEILIGADERGEKYDRTRREKEKIERLFHAPWSFNCPICYDFDSAIADLDLIALEKNEDLGTVGRMACTNCGFVVNSAQPYLSSILLRRPLQESRDQILAGYGMRADT